MTRPQIVGIAEGAILNPILEPMFDSVSRIAKFDRYRDRPVLQDDSQRKAVYSYSPILRRTKTAQNGIYVRYKCGQNCVKRARGSIKDLDEDESSEMGRLSDIFADRSPVQNAFPAAPRLGSSPAQKRCTRS